MYFNTGFFTSFDSLVASLYVFPFLNFLQTLVKMHYIRSFSLLAAIVTGPAQAAYDWQNVRFGGGGGFVDGIVFHPKSEGVAYARTDIGGLYRLNASDDSWTPLTDEICTDEGWWVNSLLYNEREFPS